MLRAKYNITTKRRSPEDKLNTVPIKKTDMVLVSLLPIFNNDQPCPFMQHIDTSISMSIFVHIFQIEHLKLASV